MMHMPPYAPMESVTLLPNNMRVNYGNVYTSEANQPVHPPPYKKWGAGFTLLEVMVALVIVGTALGASLRAIGSLTQNSNDLRVAMMATWSAENRLSQIRLAQEWPALGQRRFDCAQGLVQLKCEENVFATQNPFFRRVEVSVLDVKSTGDLHNAERRIIKLTQVVSSAH